MEESENRIRNGRALTLLLLLSITAFVPRLLAMPNSLVNISSPPMSEQNNSAFAWSEVAPPGQGYALWTEYPPAGFGTSTVMWSFTATAGAAWTGGSPLVVGAPFALTWNPAIASDINGYFFASSAGYGSVFPWTAIPNGITFYFSTGLGAPFALGPVIATNIPGATWLDYPNHVIDKYPGNPVVNVGTIHSAWVTFTGPFPDADGNGNGFDDPGDGFLINYAYSRTTPGHAPIYPAFSASMVLFAGTVSVDALAAQRPSLAVMGPPGNILVPPGGVYVAWTDGSLVYIDASPALGAPFMGPVVISPISPIPPVISGGVHACTNVTIGVGAGACAGRVYAAWTSTAGTSGTDIFFSSSPTGGAGTWSPAVRVNQDPFGTGLDQWAPKMVVDPTSGEICVSYYDRRNDAANVKVQTWVSVSKDCGMTWTDCQVSDIPPIAPASTFGMLPAPRYMGDYLGADFNAVNGSGFIWNDSRAAATDQNILFETAKGCTSACVGHCGDANGDGLFNISDAVFLIAYIFGGGPAPNPLCYGYANGDGTINISDAVYLIAYIFGGGPAPHC